MKKELKDIKKLDDLLQYFEDLFDVESEGDRKFVKCIECDDYVFYKMHWIISSNPKSFKVSQRMASFEAICPYGIVVFVNSNYQ